MRLPFMGRRPAAAPSRKERRQFARIALLLAALPGFAAELPIAGLASVGFRVSDLEAARAFYSGVLGFEEAFRIPGASGAADTYCFKVNDRQFIEITPDLAPGQDIRLTRIGIETTDARRLRSLLAARGLTVSATARESDGSLSFSLRDPDGHTLRFVEYLPSSLQARARGKFLSARRLSDRMRHTGVTVADEARAMAFYRDKLEFVEIWRGGPAPGETRWVNMRMPGASGDYIEYMLHTSPPTREQLGSMHHICLEVPDIQAAWRAAVERGIPDTDRHRPRVGRVRKWLFSIFDPDGSRTEFMEPKTVD
jgi:catechol 2,3-dioxygenase-like lactoylglutathione lyase family enzyme